MINDMVNAKDTSDKNMSIGGGELIPDKDGINYAEFLRSMREHFITDCIGNYLDKDSIGSFDMSFETMSDNNFGAIESN